MTSAGTEGLLIQEGVELDNMLQLNEGSSGHSQNLRILSLVRQHAQMMTLTPTRPSSLRRTPVPVCSRGPPGTICFVQVQFEPVSAEPFRKQRQALLKHLDGIYCRGWKAETELCVIAILMMTLYCKSPGDISQWLRY